MDDLVVFGKKRIKDIPNRENYMCKDRFEGSWHILVKCKKLDLSRT